MSADRDYYLGTHDDELTRLGVQHRVWRPTVLACWRRAGAIRTMTNRLTVRTTASIMQYTA